MILLEAKNFVKTYNNKKIINDLSFYIKKGEIVGLLGPNGAGKTTAFYMTIGLIRPDKGKIYFNQNLTLKLKNYLAPEKFYAA